MKPSVSSFGCNTYSYTITHSAQDCLTHLTALGFKEFELMMYPGHIWPPEADSAKRTALRQCVERLGVRIAALNMPNIDINIAAAAPEMRRYSLDRLTDILRLAGELGVPGVLIAPGKSNPLYSAPKEQLISSFFKALDELLPIANRAGTALWVENMPFAFLPTADEMMAVLARYGSDDIGVVYDVANAHFVNEDITAGMQSCQARLKLVHLSDTSQKTYRHDPVGSGDVPFSVVPAAMAAVGYSKRPFLEVISQNADRDILSSVTRLSEYDFA